MFKDLLIMAVTAGVGVGAVGAVVQNLGPTIGLGRVFYVVADANCVQMDYDPNQIDFAYDPNQVQGHLIGVVECTAGVKFNQNGDWCDPEGDPVTITLQSGPDWVSMTVDPDFQQFTLAGMALSPGVYYVVLELVDTPIGGSPAIRTATVILHAMARPNTAPAVRLVGSL
jgi:hypothetical protein